MTRSKVLRGAAGLCILALAAFGPASAVFGSHNPDIGDFPDTDSYVADLLHTGDGCSTDQAAGGDDVTFSGHGFEDGTQVTGTFPVVPIVVFQGPATSNPFEFSFVVPLALDSGEQTFEASGTGSDGDPLTLSCTIDVLGDEAVVSADLARTGSDVVPLLIAAIALLAIGGAVLHGTRTRTRAGTAA